MTPTETQCTPSAKHQVESWRLPVTFRCPLYIFAILLAGALAPFAIFPSIPSMGWPPIVKSIIIGGQIALIVYAAMILPTKLVISDEGIRQKLLISEVRLRWEEIAEWWHCVRVKLLL